MAENDGEQRGRAWQNREVYVQGCFGLGLIRVKGLGFIGFIRVKGFRV